MSVLAIAVPDRARVMELTLNWRHNARMEMRRLEGRGLFLMAARMWRMCVCVYVCSV